MGRGTSFATALACGILVMLATPPGVAREPRTEQSAVEIFESTTVVRSVLLAVETKDPVTQVGPRNYAGPECPGEHWNCTTARNVVQIATSGGKNRFDCTSFAKNAPSDNPCVAVQTADEGGLNRARCAQATKETDQKPQEEEQTCSITQTNTTGNNVAIARQFVLEITKAEKQEAIQQVQIEQDNGSGSNKSRAAQVLIQSAAVDKPAAQTQTSRQSFVLDQGADTGANTQSLRQWLSQDAQMSQPEKDPGPGAWAASTQTQDGLLEGFIVQESSGVSRGDNHQTGIQKLSAPPEVTQRQDPRVRCCAEQIGNPLNEFRIDQDFVQLATNPTSQYAEDIGSCFTSGTCFINQHAQQNDRERDNFVSGSGLVTASIVCRGTGESNKCEAKSEGGDR
jgi:hypothetical protein